VNISIDFDNTYTRDPELWNQFALFALRRGHKVYSVSARHEKQMDDVRNTIGKYIGVDNCYGTGLVPKKDYMWRVCGIYIDIWIDDQPEMIVTGIDFSIIN
jgi:hypothetical protein